MSRDADEAQRIVWNPELYAPCLENWQDSCWPQYITAVIFGIIGLLALLETYFVFKTWRKFDSKEGNKTSRETRVDLKQGSRSWGLTVMRSVDKLHPYVGTSFAAGGKWFWYRAWFTLLTEVGFQIMRGFLLYDAYAKVSAPQTLAQTILIVLQINVFILCFHRRSEVASVFTGLCFEIAYLTVRVTIYGRLSLRTTSFWDMLTIVGPLLITVSELYEILHFITHGSMKGASGYDYKNRCQANVALSVLVIFVTSAGALVCLIIVRTGFMEECPRAYGIETRPDDYLLPTGVDCYAWHYNLFLTPACSCIYLSLNPLVSRVCSGLGANNHQAIADLIPHLDDVRFLNVWKVDTGGCFITSKDLDLFSNMRRLRSIIFEQADFLVDFPESFGQWEDLRAFEIEYSNNLTRLDPNVVGKWTRLERFSCWYCNKLDSVEVLQEVTLPRLNWVLVHGVESCSGFESFSGDFSCTELSAPRTCALLPEYQLQAQLDSVRIARERHTCAKDICQSHYIDFGLIDRNNNGMLSFAEYIRFAGLADHGDAATHVCEVNAIRNELSKVYQEDFTGINVTDELTYIEHMVAKTQYTTCLDCSFSSDVLQMRKDFYDNSVNKSDPCWMVEQYGQGAYTIESLIASCRKVETSCHPAICPIALSNILRHDHVTISTSN